MLIMLIPNGNFSLDQTASSEEENMGKLYECAVTIENCLKGCDARKKKIEELLSKLRSDAGEQKNLERLMMQTVRNFRREFERCGAIIFEEVKSGSIHLGTKPAAVNNVREAGRLVLPDDAEKLGNIRKMTSKIRTALLDAQVHAELLLKQCADLQDQHTECMKDCENRKEDCSDPSAAVKHAMEQGVASQAAVKVLAAFDAVTDRIRGIYRDASNMLYERQRIERTTETILDELLSCEQLPWGIPINGNTDWETLGFQSNDSVSKAAEEYSGGLFIPADMVRISEAIKSLHAKSVAEHPKQPREIPSNIRILAPLLALSGKPMTVSLTDEAGVPITGGTELRALLASDQGDTWQSDENGSVHIPALSSTLHFVSIFMPGTPSTPSLVRLVKPRPGSSPQSMLLHLAAASDIVHLGCICDVTGNGLDGNAANTEIAVADRKLAPLAESPVALKFRIPEDLPPGSYTVTVKEKERTPAEIPLLCVRSRMSADRLELKKGETIEVRINIEGTELPLSVEVINHTPLLVSIDERVVEVKNGKGSFRIRGLQPGPFSIGLGAVKIRG
jgi:hypothetical protein